jgi:hypothetical protein
MIERFRRLIESRRQQRTHDLRMRVAEDVERTRMLMTATIIDARRVGATVPAEVAGSVVIWAAWAIAIERWAQESEA